ncbi:MAG: helix-turn-helix domain-containing protein [Chthoniobacterales bacterium]
MQVNPPSTGAVSHEANHQANKIEWMRVPEAVRMFGICRSSIYELISSGEIKSTSLKKRGALRGIRIISFDSLSSYCERAAAMERDAK